jgi:hypothetical protein
MNKRVEARFWTLFGVGMGALMLGLGALFGIMYLVYPPAGPQMASTAVFSGEPFVLRYTSDGKAQRVWLDIDCDDCGSPNAQGSIEVSREGGARIAQQTIEDLYGGYAVSHEERGGTHHIVHGHILFEVPAQPASTVVFLRGTLTVPPVQSVTLWPPGPQRPPPPPRVFSMRVWVAP